MGRSVADWARGAADAQWRRRACQACGVSARGTVRAKLCRLPGPRVWVSVDGTWAGMTVGLSEVRTAGGFDGCWCSWAPTGVRTRCVSWDGPGATPRRRYAAGFAFCLRRLIYCQVLIEPGSAQVAGIHAFILSCSAASPEALGRS